MKLQVKNTQQETKTGESADLRRDREAGQETLSLAQKVTVKETQFLRPVAAGFPETRHLWN